MSENSYYCPRCKRNHRYTSKIGQEHLKYKDDEGTFEPEEIDENQQIEVTVAGEEAENENISPPIEDDTLVLPEISKKAVPRRKRNRVSEFIHGYRRSYKVGVEKFGIWWKIFQLSIWSLALIFLITAALIFIIYLPKIEMIYWELR